MLIALLRNRIWIARKGGRHRAARRRPAGIGLGGDHLFVFRVGPVGAA